MSSESGDADLYVSNENKNPTYEPDSYMLHSATCGDDFIHIHKKLKRPIYVSVFGHSSFEISIFYLKIVARDSTEEDLIDFQLLDLKSEQSFDIDVLTDNYTLNYTLTEETNLNVISETGDTDLLLQTLDVDQALAAFNQTTTTFISSQDESSNEMSFFWSCLQILQIFLSFM